MKIRYASVPLKRSKQMGLFFKSVLLFLGLCLCVNKAFFAEENQRAEIGIIVANLPLINSIETRDKDEVFYQYQQELEKNYARGLKAPQMNFYAYKAKKGDTVTRLAARFNLIADSFVTINNIANSEENLDGRLLVMPTVRGLFVGSEENEGGTPIENLLQKNRYSVLEKPSLLWYSIGGRKYTFFPDERFTPTERAFFLDPGMVLPVKNFRISSSFGGRANPFDAKSRQFHKGVDMAVPEGSDVFACKSGRIISSGENRVYGKWILIDHSGGLSSFYAHLSAIKEGIADGKRIGTGELIAKSGSTGLVTGPHLHFEIRKNGNPVNPNAYF